MVVPEPRGGVSEGKIRLSQPLTGQGARAHDAGLQGSCPARKRMKARFFRGKIGEI